MKNKIIEIKIYRMGLPADQTIMNKYVRKHYLESKAEKTIDEKIRK